MLKPEDDLVLWSEALLESTEPGGEYRHQIDDCAMMFYRIAENDFLPEPNKENTHYFKSRVIPKFVVTLLNFKAVERTESSLISNFLVNILNSCFTMFAKSEISMLQLAIHITSKNRPFYQFNGKHVADSPNIYWVPEQYYRITGNIPTKLFLGPVIKFLIGANFDQNMGLFCYIFGLFRDLASLWTLEHTVQFADDVALIIQKVLSSISSSNLRSIENRPLFIFLSGSFHFVARIDDDEEIKRILDFSFFCLKSDFLDKQCIGVDILCEATKMSDNCKRFFNKWAKSTNLIDFIIGKDLHEAVFSNLSILFAYFLESQEMSIIHMNIFLQRLASCQPFQRRQLINLITASMQSLNPASKKNFVNNLLNIKQVNMDLMDLLCNIALTFDSEQTDEIVTFILSLRHIPNLKLVANKGILTLCSLSPSPRIHQLLMKRFFEEFIRTENEDIMNDTLMMMKSLISTANVLPDCSVDEFLDAALNHKHIIYIYKLTGSYMASVDDKITEEQAQKLFDIFSQSDIGWQKFSKLLNMKAQWLFTCESLNRLWFLIEETPIDGISDAAITFIYILIIATALHEKKIEDQFRPLVQYNGLSHEFTLKTLNLRGFDFLVRVYTETERCEEMAKHYINIIFRMLIEFDFSSIAAFLYNRFRLLNVKQRMIELIYELILGIFEVGFDPRDFGLARHKMPRHRDEVKIILKTQSNEIFDIYLPQEATIDLLYTAASKKLRIQKTDFKLRLDSHHFVDVMDRMLLNYHITNNSVLTVVNSGYKVRKITPSKTELLSFHLQLMTPDLLQILLGIKNETGAEKSQQIGERNAEMMQKSAWRLLKILPSDKILTEKVQQGFDVKGNPPYIICYIIQIFINLKIEVSSDVDFFVNTLLYEKKTPDFMVKAILELLYRNKPHKMIDRIDDMVPYLLRNIETGAKDKIQLFSIHVLNNLIKYDTEKTTNAIIKNAELLTSAFLRSQGKVCNFFHFLLNNATSKEVLFEISLSIFDKVTPEKYVYYFPLLGALITRNCSIENILERLIDLLDDASVSDFLVKALPLNPDIVFCHQQLAIKLATLAFRQANLDNLEIIFQLCQFVVKNDPKQLLMIKPFFYNKLFSLKFDHWSYEPRRQNRGYYCGLRNMGATCYMNSVLQQLFYNEDFLINLFKFSDECTDNKWIPEMKNIFSRLFFTNLPYVDTEKLCDTLKFPDNQPLNVRIQHDATEFLQYILDKSPKELQNLYKGTIINVIEGVNEEFTSKITEPFFSLCLPVRDFTSFEDSFSSLLTEIAFTGENQYYAESLGKKIDARKYARIQDAGSCLVIQLKRFDIDVKTWTRYKVNNYFEFPDFFDLTPYTVDPNGEPQIYDLSGVIIHAGKLDGGHYSSFVSKRGQWLYMNDENVNECTNDQFADHTYGNENYDYEGMSVNPSAYLLFYTRRNKSDIDEDANENECMSEEIWNEKMKANILKRKNLIGDKLFTEIQNENKSYTRDCCLFSKSTVNFVSSIGDLELLFNFYLNVFSHSNHSQIAKDLQGLIVSKMNVNDLVDIINSKSNEIIEILLRCVNSEILNNLVIILGTVFRLNNPTDTFAFVQNIVNNLTCCVQLWRQSSYFGNVIHIYLISGSSYLEKGIENAWPNAIVDFLLNMYKEGKSYMIQNINLAIFFNMLTMFEQPPIDSLVPISYLIMQSGVHSQEYLKLILKFSNIIKLDDLILSIAEHSRDTSLQGKENLLAQIFALADSASNIKRIIELAYSRLGITDKIMAKLIGTRVQNADYEIMTAILNYPEYLIYPLITSPHSACANAMEGTCLRLFPQFQSLPDDELAEDLIKPTNCLHMEVSSDNEFEPYNQPLMISDVSEEDKQTFIIFFNKIIDAMEIDLPNMKENVQRNGSKTRFVHFLRVLNWMILRLKCVTEPQLNVILNYTQNIRNPSFDPDCNLLESIRIFLNVPEPLKTDFARNHLDDFIEMVFPTTRKYAKFSHYMFTTFFVAFENVIPIEFCSTNIFMEDWKNFYQVSTSCNVKKFEKSLSKVGDYSSFMRPLLLPMLNEDGNINKLSNFVFYFFGRLIKSCEELGNVVHWYLRQVNEITFGENADKVVTCIKKLWGEYTPHEVLFAAEYMPKVVDTIADNFGAKENLRELVLLLCRESLDLTWRVLSCVVDYQTDDPARFWAVNLLFLNGIELINDFDKREELMGLQIEKTFEFMDTISSNDAGSCFLKMAAIVNKFGYEKNETWAMLLYVTLMELPSIIGSMKPFIIEVLKTFNDDQIIEQFQQIAANVYLDSPVLGSSIEKAAIILTARPEIRDRALENFEMTNDLEENWPRLYSRFIPVFKK